MPKHIDRRQLLGAGAAGLMLPSWAQSQDPAALLKTGGVVIAFRHALAPGTFDPPGFQLGDCSTQRNLNDEGRAQARRIGAWFKSRGLRPAAVRASPWCRCVETAELAFGTVQAWPALGSPRAGTEETNAQSLGELRAALGAASRQPGRFEVWVTHMFVLSDLLGVNSASGEGLLLGVASDGAPRLLGRLSV
jgi:hypothetical protein